MLILYSCLTLFVGLLGAFLITTAILRFILGIRGTRPPFLPDRIARGIKYGTKQITSDFLHRCVRIFGLTSARQRGLDDKLTDEECIGLLTAPLMKDIDQGKFQL